MVNSYLSRCGLTTKYMTKSARNDMLTIHAIGWNKRKQDGLHLALSCRYVKTLQKAEAASQKLRDLCSDLDCPEDMVHQWVEDVRQWAKAEGSRKNCDYRLGRVAANNAGREAIRIRETFTSYFCRRDRLVA
ncbi:unnamed protein product [Gadus morhua 'NCC']